MSEFDLQLSPQGHRRREQILGSAIREARHRQHRRRAAALAGATLAMVIGIVMLSRPLVTQNRIGPQPLSGSPTVAVATPSKVVVEHIQTDPTISERLALVPKQQRWKPLDDRELLQVLADAGKPSALIEYDGRALLLPRRTVQR